MSRYLEILRKAKLEGELFSTPREPGARRSSAPAVSTPPSSPSPWSRQGTQHRDQWQQLVYRLFLPPAARLPRSIAMASATSGEGTSYVAFHLAVQAARATGNPTLLLEANLYRPSQAGRFGLSGSPGLREILHDEQFPLEACLHQTAFDRLWLLPAGSAGNGLAGLPDWTNFRGVFFRLRQRFPAIVGDLPPVNTSDALILGPFFDAAVLVVEADLASREVIQNAATRLRRANSSVAGAVLNKRKFFVPEPLYRRLG
ncbi:MAG TPA: CpsD/CapB family tyrosine-protein kinase [Bryobacterales bacterium]|jgi:protein-tyrosine kinase|nr:CpsD/CapB family tyrosine-protein kinase [Bryobacterales bacterium]